ncbi:MGMT family protein [Aspergillus homomorphus CBS 101889]|uniref:MGMT family protein n=1 Tax=Aspergillus homomorphus (strain CBS 101889) TaxID=1450537 RepID=A0A395HY81_ASPHC|nr:MGMT family protein [Aspergillus homomorphus CBS 101889]RAL12881.1 MGMT family protein [Aspergillus homomorphus CBS 101889]
MPRSDEAEWWINAVYEAVQEIPAGRVTSYGHIALLLGYPKRPRQVGVSLKHLPSDPRRQDADVESEAEAEASSTPFFHSGNVPWQRVINSKGMISHRGPGSAERQAEALRAEGVEVEVDAMGEFYVDTGRFGWFPEVLPSEEGLDSEGERNEDGGDSVGSSGNELFC